MVRDTSTYEKSDIFQLKKRLLLLAFFLRFFFCGAEYSVILPTALIYMKSLQASHLFMGLVVAAYPLSAMIALPIFGHLYDKTKRTRELLLVLNAFEIVGNILYALPYSKWLPCAGRFIAGVGDGFIVLAAGEVTYLYSSSARIGILSIMELGRVCGLILGPMLNFLIANNSYIIYGWKLDNKTLPGAIMALNWILMEFITIFCVFNLAKEVSEPSDIHVDSISPAAQYKVENEEIILRGRSLSNQPDYNENESLFFAETSDGDEALSSEEEGSIKRTKQREAEEKSLLKEENTKEKEKPFWHIIRQLLTFELFMIFLVDLVLWYSQTIFEILLPYITEFDYGWDPLMTGVVYMLGGVVLLVVFGALMFTSGKIRDTHLLLIALILTQISLALLIYESTFTNLKKRLYTFVAICILVFSTIPLNLVCSKSIITKLFPQESQGKIQGIYSSVSRLALLGGPLVGSSIFEKRIAYGAVFSVICFFTIIGLFFALEKLHKREDQMVKMNRL